MHLSLEDTIAAGKAWLLERLDDGSDCPLCGQTAKMYRRKINAGMARSLITMYRLNALDWVHVRDIGAASREEGKLAYWGLIEEQRATANHGGRAGYWRVTPRGESFLRGLITVDKYARVYDGKLYGFTGGPVGIRDALGTKFSYEDLMKGI